MKNMQLTGLFLGITFIFTSCASSLVVLTPYRQVTSDSIEEMALFPVMIGNLETPVFPLIDAAFFDKKVNSISNEIMTMQSKKVDEIRERTAEILEEYFNCKVLYGKELQAKESYDKLYQKYNFTQNLLLGELVFSKILVASGDMNPYPFIKGDVINHFREEQMYQVMVRNLCRELDVDAIAVGYSRLWFGNVQPFGISAKLKLSTYIVIFNKEGKIIGQGNASSKGFNTKGKDVAEYELSLDDFSLIFRPLVQKIISLK